jgi:uncharacterized repeat protein (TIGR02543 family)
MLRRSFEMKQMTFVKMGGLALTLTLGLVASISLTLAGCEDLAGGGDRNNTDSSAITYTVAANGTGSTTTGLTFTFSAVVNGLTANNITISGTGVTRGSLTGSGTTWTLAVTVATAGTITVSIAKLGIENGQKQVTVYKQGQAAITYMVADPHGYGNTTTTLTFAFGTAVSGLTAGDITLTNGPGSVTKGALTGSGTTWTLAVTVATAGTITVSIAKPGIESGQKQVTVYKQGQVTYFISFRSQGSGWIAPTITAIQGTAFEKPGDPTKAGYTFKGWYNAEYGGTECSWPHILMEDTVMYAQWTVIEYPITYIWNGGTTSDAYWVSYRVDLTFSLPTPTRDGYTFAGWYDNLGFSGNAVTSIPAGSMGNKTFWAKWTPNTPVQYTITYVLNGGINSGANQATYTIESLPLSLAAPTRTGYTFEGWYDNAVFLYTVTSIPAGSTGDKTFYAAWMENYTITYVLNGGTNSGANPATYTIVSLPLSLTTPTRTGYTFVGWYYYPDFSGNPVTTPITVGSMGNKTFYAKWTANSSGQPITLTINDLIDPAGGAITEEPFTLTKPNGTKTITVIGGGTDAVWHIGLAEI